MKPGVWNLSDQADCVAEPTAALEQWPACGEVLLVRETDLVSLSASDDGAWTWTRTPFVLSATDPRVLQLKTEADELPTPYAYAVLQPTASDEQGRVTGFTTVLLTCDGAAPAGTVKEVSGVASEEAPPLLPGLTRVDGGCVADSREALLEVARMHLKLPGLNTHYATFVRD